MRHAAVTAAFALFPSFGFAQDVTLTSRDGTLSVSGEFRGYDGELYRIETEYGLLTLDAQAVVCDGPACPDLTQFVAEVRVAGEPGMASRLLDPLLAAFAGQRGLALRVSGDGVSELAVAAEGRVVARFRFLPASSVEAADALRLGRADLALAALAEPDLRARTLGLESLVAIVAPDNPVRQLATTDLARALSGEVQNWAAFGGPDRPLVIHALVPDAGFRRALEARLGQAIVSGSDHASLDDLDRAVARDPWGLAVTAGSAVDKARALDLTDSCGFRLKPDPLSVKAEDYPLTQPFFVLTPKRRLPLIAREFLDFMATPAAGQAIAQSGLVDRAVDRADLLTDGVRLANAIRAAGPEVQIDELQRLTRAMQGAQRLSLTFRFEDGARTLDAASRDNLLDLVRLVDLGAFDEQELIFVGFSDGSGSATANLDLSRDRAELLRQDLAAALSDGGPAGVTLAADGFGEALPIACDESPIGRELNRRVELWVRPVTGSQASEN
jgi:phosphate transport system substrate-binding protein